MSVIEPGAATAGLVARVKAILLKAAVGAIDQKRLEGLAKAG